MTVIYLFVSPSGRAYAGRHTCQHEGWPRRGSGALPSGYRGSGNVWQHVVRKHGPAIRWVILRRFGHDAVRADIDAAERRAIRLARHLWADRCVNRAEGGTGNTSAYALSLWADPQFAGRSPVTNAKRSAAMKAIAQTPEGAAVLARAQAASHTPDAIAKQKVRAQTPEGREQLASVWAGNKARARTSEGAAALAKARAASKTPEALAKAAATRLRNKTMEAQK
ncbi:hypothetical protein [Paracoccus aminovorans]|uniref:hypothetical protein n=1 Tax=Paracoccus aminovorans TaxID=34004 RepID=UPI002B258B1E|nr:hypothetical protein [Paracoccus aminovorans]